MPFLRQKNDEPRVDLTPMVDVVFLLLIFFMISTTFVESPGLSIKLPESSAETVDREPKEIKIYLSKEGDIYHKDHKVTLDEFRQVLAEHGDQAEQTTFMLLADKDAKHGKVVRLMDLARDAGYLKLAIATEQKKK